MRYIRTLGVTRRCFDHRCMLCYGRWLLGRQLSPQLDNLPLHLSVLAALAYALEARFDFAFQIEALAARADRKGFLYDITTQLCRTKILASRGQWSVLSHTPSADDTHCMPA